ncbi:thiamine pyrophosphokinase [Enterococcus sp. PF1-24]|uniref:thiamine diphosphokinase n=1 Tax=unclassified Enterococcus TaxID=2608891 RepID=UPI0024735572|nr:MULTISPECIES: thiamine diphosphokinase [unclassified Enterococcus]MDH6364276.1 thiamine pyrophosphokinase [Enterococcus sp. PFB1-1]MDH6401365.1 thiamine pyrophosphokinase [Enterococcus sp. PF1-24]
MKILLVAGGKPETWPDFDFTTFDRYIGVDKGSWYLLEQVGQLDLAVGDFDSLIPAEKTVVLAKAGEVETAPAEKDDSDTQLALWETLQRWPQGEITIIGATGGRLDHLLANLWLGLEQRFQPYLSQLEIADKQNRIRYYLPGSYTVQQIPGFDYLAYCCLTPVKNLTLRDSKYLLNNVSVTTATAYISNEFLTSKADFSFSEGCIAVIQSRD